MSRRMAGYNRAPHLVLAAAVGIGMTGVLGACTQEQEEVYCVDENNIVVDEDLCDDDRGGGGGYFILIGNFGGGYHGPGTRLNAGSGRRISASDSTARRNAGISSTGKVSNGSKTSKSSSSGGGGSSGGWGGSKGGSGSGS